MVRIPTHQIRKGMTVLTNEIMDPKWKTAERDAATVPGGRVRIVWNDGTVSLWNYGGSVNTIDTII